MFSNGRGGSGIQDLFRTKDLEIVSMLPLVFKSLVYTVSYDLRTTVSNFKKITKIRLYASL